MPFIPSWTPGPGPSPSSSLPSSGYLQAKVLVHTHTLQKPKDSTELDSLSSPSPRLGWEATVSGLKTPTTYEPEERIRERLGPLTEKEGGGAGRTSEE